MTILLLRNKSNDSEPERKADPRILAKLQAVLDRPRISMRWFIRLFDLWCAMHFSRFYEKMGKND